MLVGVMGGPRFDRSWSSSEDMLDFFDAKGILETVFSRLRVKVSHEPGEDQILLPGRVLDLIADGQKIGVLGEVHPKTAALFDISSQPVILFEVDLKKLLSFTGQVSRYQAIPKFPAIVRDLALVVDIGLSADKVQDIIQSFPLVSQVTLFNLYIGKQVPEDKKSLAFSIRYQSPQRTLTDAEIDSIQQKIIERLGLELGATLRS